MNKVEKLANDFVVLEHQQYENFDKLLKEREAFKSDSKKMLSESNFHIDHLKTYCKEFQDYIQGAK